MGWIWRIKSRGMLHTCVVMKSVVHHHSSAMQATRHDLRIELASCWRYRSRFICNSRTHARSSFLGSACTPWFLFFGGGGRIYFPEGVASEIFQGLISPGVALLIQDWEMLHSLLKLFECDSVVSQLAQNARCTKDVEHRGKELSRNFLTSEISLIRSQGIVIARVSR